MKDLNKKYQVWAYNSDGGYSLYEYDTLDECIMSTKYTDNWYITKKVEIKIDEVLTLN